MIHALFHRGIAAEKMRNGGEKMEKGFALKINEKDNVAVVLSEGLRADTIVSVRSHDGASQDLKARNDIPYGHKIAVAAVAPGEEIIKYGEVIGACSHAILPGEHVHIHNMDSLRGRGDLGQDA